VIKLADAEFRKSTFSGGGNDCVEVATNVTGMVGLRDSKLRGGPINWFTYSEWRPFTAGVRDGRFDV
jgi:hypothetical protein